ncbi:MAG: HEAT repeat domain-containing protein [Gammaproteobacteria bacterium]
MILNKLWVPILLAVLLDGCGDAENGESEKKDGKDLASRVSESGIHIRKDGQNQGVGGEAPASGPNRSSRPLQDDDEPEDIEDLEAYRRDYEDAVEVDDKSEALAALVQADEKNAAVLLQQAYQNPDPDLRKEAVLLMQDYTDDDRVLDLLLSALDDPDSEVVLEAVEGLSEVEENQRALDGLARTAQSHPDESVREAAKESVELAKEFDQ